MLQSFDIIGLGLYAFLGASLIVAGLALWTGMLQARHASARRDALVFLFEGPHLVDATPAARRALRAQAGRGGDWAGLLKLLERGFGTDLELQLTALPLGGRLSFDSSTGLGTLEVTEEGGALRLTLHPDEAGASALDRLAFEAAQDELRLLRGLAEDAPQAIWTLGPGGALTWANRAYLALADLAHGPYGQPAHAAPVQATWPAWSLFNTPTDVPEGGVWHERLPLVPPDCEEPLWYDVTSLHRSVGRLQFATDVTALVQAETMRLHFIQTLAKTFAELSIGLVVFDRDRRLVLFNPAFLDLTGLPVDFLTGRPLVQAVLDRLRDARMLPEPRDYTAWRESVAALEAAATAGEYCETWTLSGGQIYRVTGRPHPDGALAFLFEDISGDVGLARSLRTELDTMRDVLDTLGEAMAVFSATGTLALSNTAYAALWGPPASTTDLIGEAARWEAASLPSPAWERLKTSIASKSSSLEECFELLHGQRLLLSCTTLPRGATLVRFHEDRPAARPAATSAQVRQAEPA